MVECFNDTTYHSDQSSSVYVATLDPNDIRDYVKTLSDAKSDIEHNLFGILDGHVIKPVTLLKEVLKKARLKISKREHKLVDFDRHRDSLQSATKSAKAKSSTFSDEKKLIKAQSAFDEATKEYNKLNDLLKKELPVLMENSMSILACVFKALFYFQKRFVAKNVELCAFFTRDIPNKQQISDAFDEKRRAYDIILDDIQMLKSFSTAGTLEFCSANFFNFRANRRHFNGELVFKLLFD